MSPDLLEVPTMNVLRSLAVPAALLLLLARLLGAPACAAPEAAAAAPEPTAWGPPAVCLQFDVGDARSIPWGSGAFSPDLSFDPDDAIPDGLAVLRASDDALVHMETIRRMVIYVSGIEGVAEDAGDDWRRGRRHELLSRLRAHILAAVEAERASDRELALAWFDLGYAQAAMAQLGGHGIEWPAAEEDCAPAIARAAELAPDDGAVRLGAALALWTHRDLEAVRWRHLDAAASRAEDPDGLLRRNLLACARRLLGGTDDWDDLRAKLRAELREA